MASDSRQIEKPIRKLQKLLRKFLRKLKVKELHNLQLAENGTDQEFVESRDDVKDAISEWHDWVELQAIAEKVLGSIDPETSGKPKPPRPGKSVSSATSALAA
jgi:hydroxylamine reductase (hybrid-cluster protein)